MTKKLHIKTYGCQMNVYDSGRMADVLAPLGYRLSETQDDADLVILNTCHIREKAAEKVFSELGRLKALKQAKSARGGRMLLAVAGCVAQAEGAEIIARAPYVDIVLGPQTYHRLPEMIAAVTRVSGGVLDTEFPPQAKFDFLPDSAAPQGVAAFLTIQEGCDKFCTFCVVPYTRGAEFSRPGADIIAEARRLVGQGTREITLLGQNVNAYRGASPEGGRWTLGALIRALAEIPGLWRIRYTTSHPRDMDDGLIETHRDIDKLMPLLHLPVQSGADRMLTAMNRRHSVDEYRRTIDKLRAARLDMAFSSDFIVGYPGETDRDFQATIGLVREIGFAQAYSFKFSPRPGTPAAMEANKIPEQVKDARLDCLQALLDEQLRDFNRGTVGQTLPVLFEKLGRHPGQVVGRSPYFQAVHVTAPTHTSPEKLIGLVLPVRVIGVKSYSLTGELIAAGERVLA